LVSAASERVNGTDLVATATRRGAGCSSEACLKVLRSDLWETLDDCAQAATKPAATATANSLTTFPRPKAGSERASRRLWPAPISTHKILAQTMEAMLHPQAVCP
jgi:hypothetical protein